MLYSYKGRRKEKGTALHCRSLLALFTLFAIFFASPVLAQCISPDAPEGSQVYNPTHDVMQYCDGSKWISMDGSLIAPAVPDDMGNHTATANIDMGGFKIINLGVPSDPGDAATKAYVDSVTGAGETDPKVGALVNSKWCQGDEDGVVQCIFDAPSAGSSTGQCVARDQKNSGTNGGTAVQNTWTKRNFTDVVCHGIADVSIASGSVNLPVGQYYIDAISAYGGIADQAGTRVSVNGQTQYLPFTHAGPTAASSSGYVRMNGLVNVKTAGPVDLQYYNAYGAAANTGLGYPASHAGTAEVYATMSIKQISSTPIPDDCSLDGQNVAHNASHVFYNTQAHANCASQSQSRICNNGNFDGSPAYQYASCGLPVTATYVGQGTSTSTGTTINFGSFNVPTNGLVVVIATVISDGAGTIGSVSIGGTNGAIAYSTPSGNWRRAIATREVTSGNRNVTVNLTGAQGTANTHSVEVWVLTNYLSTTPVSTNSAIDNSVASHQIALDIPAGGVALYSAIHANANNTVWSSAGENADTTVSCCMGVVNRKHANGLYSSNTTQNGFNQTVSWSGATVGALTGASWR